MEPKSKNSGISNSVRREGSEYHNRANLSVPLREIATHRVEKSQVRITESCFENDIALIRGQEIKDPKISFVGIEQMQDSSEND